MLKIVFINIFILTCLILIIEFSSYFIYQKYFSVKDPLPKLNNWSSFYNNFYNKRLISPRDEYQKMSQSTYEPSFPYKFTLNNYGIRNTPNPPKQKTRDLLLFGGSFAFGSEVNDNETLAYFLQKKTKGIKVHNLGMPGYGITESADLFDKRNYFLKDELPFIRPIYLYLFIPDHINRLLLKANHLIWTQLNTVKILDIDNDKTIFFRNSSPLKYFFTALLKTSSFLRIVFLKLTNTNIEEIDQIPIEEKDIVETAKALLYLERAFKKNYPNGSFYVVNLDNNIQSIRKVFKKSKVKVLNENFNIHIDKRMPDRHYSSEGNEELSEIIIKLLNKENIFNE